MASILKVDDLRGNTAAGNITITSEGGSATMQLQQGMVKSWISINTTGTIATRDSFNVSSATDEGTGAQSIAVTNSFSGSDNMSPSAAAWNNNASNGQYGGTSGVKDSSTYWVGAFWGTTTFDVLYVFSNVHGDLA